MKSIPKSIVVLVLAGLLGVLSPQLLELARPQPDPYRVAENVHDGMFGEYADVTFIGADERIGDALMVVMVRNKPMPDQFFFEVYDPFMGDWLLGLLDNEPGIVLMLYQPENNAVVVMTIGSAVLAESGTLTGGLLNIEVAAGPLEPELLAWQNK